LEDEVADKVIDWLLEKENPSVRFFTLSKIQDLPVSDPLIIKSKKEIINSDPVIKLLAIQDQGGWWGNSDQVTMPMYTSTVWQLIILAELGASVEHPAIRKAVDFVFASAQDSQGAFPHEGSRFQKQSPMDLICNDAMIAWGLIGAGTPANDPRMKKSIDFLTNTLAAGDFRCRFNKGAPCAWGIVKGLRVLAAVPKPQRSQEIERAILKAVQFILGEDLSKASYPTKPGGKVSGHWFKLGFPRSYQTDILQTLMVLSDLGYASDDNLIPAIKFLQTIKLPDGTWPLEETFSKWLVPFLKKSSRQPSKWITWQVVYILKSAKPA
jgi:hypothetical protein